MSVIDLRFLQDGINNYYRNTDRFLHAYRFC